MLELTKTIFMKLIHSSICNYEFYKLTFLIFKPKIVIFSQEGSYSRLINFLSKKDIISVDFQHGMQSGSIPIFRHSKILSTEYKTYLPDYTFTFGNYWNKYYSYYSKAVSVGNPLYEKLSKSNIKNNSHKNGILIVSEGVLSKSTLVNAALYLSKNNPKNKIYYKLRPEEYSDAKESYKILYDKLNIKIIDNENIHLYDYICLSEYVVGINSTVLIESLNQANVVVLKDGWYFEMNDLIQNEFILFAENYSELENIIKNKKESRKKVNIDEIFKKCITQY